MLDVKTLKSAAYVASILRNISRYKFSKVKVIGHKMACFLTTRSRSVPSAMDVFTALRRGLPNFTQIEDQRQYNNACCNES
ncbi:hypothetical protein BTJ19_07635 [Lactobacillus delbrueckii subsp. bulgaricus]|nr:hypothetical protein [Lactobacillus delbrueckii subsp. bulgaricus]MBT8837130.1 hypothetical protein [Lactobacillus delbrueckii subsp. bulgaricus]MBT8918692.1 hypothetical protein [Lactobacillus delbrueckii subsp. bulgaricus]MBT8925000.1 hypothetical protein [Lactobacillus delbrueckii subsp. bulgaricus]MBT8929496.1 hypothetical protein [Lactobacillus delbrueckii subsp. bulgaricus]